MNYDTSRERFQRLMQEAPALSPITAHYYQKYCANPSPEQRFFTQTVSTLPAGWSGGTSVEVQPDGTYKNVFLQVNLCQPDAKVISSIHHEMSHVDQIFRSMTTHMREPTGFVDRTLMSIMGEGHAFANQVEGPTQKIIGLLDGLRVLGPRFLFPAKVLAQIESAAETINPKFAPSYFNGFFGAGSGIDLPGDRVGYLIKRYKGNHRSLTEKQRSSCVTEGRKSVVREFTRTEENQDNFFLDKYLYNFINDFCSHERPARHTTYDLFRYAGLCRNYDRPFLSEADWCDALGGSSKVAIFSGIVQHSRHRNSIAGVLEVTGEKLGLDLI